MAARLHETLRRLLTAQADGAPDYSAACSACVRYIARSLGQGTASLGRTRHKRECLLLNRDHVGTTDFAGRECNVLPPGISVSGLLLSFRA